VSVRKVLVTGGAGYIGSTIASACLDAGITPVLLDNLSVGRREYTTDRIFYQGDIADGALLDRIFTEHPDIDAAVHCAALIVVPDSVADPVGYYRNNVVGSLRLVEGLLRNGCGRLLFSSSAAIYGSTDGLVIDEDTPMNPQCPYARTKVVCEQMFAEVAAAQPIRVLSLRYFNPVGADPRMRTGLQHAEPSHALGKLMTAHRAGTPFQITGTDYDTSDGTGVRDYLHVWDLARAHLAALERFDTLLGGEVTSLAINLGSGRGTTVRELLTAFNTVVDTPVAAVEAPRRPGDVAGGYTRVDRAGKLLGWQCTYTLEQGIADSLAWAELRQQRLAGS
jgi:UDP-glucose 4-epimerase